MTIIKTSLVGLFLLVAVAVSGAVYFKHQISNPLNVAEPTLMVIPKGTTGHGALSLLQNSGFTGIDTLTGKLWLKFFAQGGHVKAGTYQLTGQMTLADAFLMFSQGAEYQFSVSLIDGLTLQQWETILANHPQINNDLSAPVTADLLAQWPWQPEDGLASLEGLFLADTYHFTANTRASTILRRAMHSMQEYLAAQWDDRTVGLPLASPYEALILASIIEKETAVGAERARIAGVFVNRLEQNMRLQTDPTVIYGIGASFDGNITRRHLREETAYNTYVIRGLPPTPIAMAGRPAIKAALNPALTDELYFVAKGDGSHQFSQTLEEHNQAVRKYQLN